MGARMHLATADNADPLKKKKKRNPNAHLNHEASNSNPNPARKKFKATSADKQN
jgi:hypothetical protein